MCGKGVKELESSLPSLRLGGKLMLPPWKMMWKFQRLCWSPHASELLLKRNKNGSPHEAWTRVQSSGFHSSLKMETIQIVFKFKWMRGMTGNGSDFQWICGVFQSCENIQNEEVSLEPLCGQSKKHQGTQFQWANCTIYSLWIHQIARLKQYMSRHKTETKNLEGNRVQCLPCTSRCKDLGVAISGPQGSAPH